MNENAVSLYALKSGRVACLLAVALGGVLLAACSRREAVDRPPVLPRSEGAGGVSVQMAAHAAGALARKPATDAVPALPFRLCALHGTVSDPRAGVEDLRTGRTVTLRKGDKVSGFIFSAADLEHETALFDKEGQSFRLGLQWVPPAKSGARDASEDEAPDVPLAMAMQFDATPAEKSAGIDPNNPATWPENYRGPGIERALKEVPGGEPGEGRTSSADVPVYKPTARETAAGIDPNNPETWPENYRGPGIERALREGGGLAPAAGAPKAAPPPDAN